MTLFKLKSAPFILIKDDVNKNILPLVTELIPQEKTAVNVFCLEQPVSMWKNIFKNHSHVNYYEQFNPDVLNKCTSTKCSVLIDSVNQMSLCLSWNTCLKYMKKLSSESNVVKLVLILHKDCLLPSSKLQIHLNHIASAIVSYDSTDNSRIKVKLKKGGKIVRSEEILTYDTKLCTLRCTPVVKEVEKVEEPDKPLPSNLTTFKIEVDQTDKLEKYKLKLPYMSKINEGESKVYYEPDAVDDWDEEDPDEDLDI